jgi:hypothetical protein
MSENLWPKFDALPPTPSPKVIVEASGAGLKQNTQGLVTFEHMNTIVDGSTVTIQYGLYARKLAYMYPFLRISFSISSNYPVTLVADKVTETFTIGNEGALVAALRVIFQAPATVSSIQNLMTLTQ